MASSYERTRPPPPPPPTTRKEEQQVGEPTTIGQHLLQKGAELMQSLAPVKRLKQHACSFALYSHDTRRQIETHHYLARLNQDFLQCAVYDADDHHARLIGVEYIISERVFETLPSEEQKLWHSHAYEIRSGLWIHPRVPDLVEKVELRELAKTYGKFWCTWQVDRGDKLPIGAPALMASPQPSGWGLLKPDVVMKRDERYGIKTDQLKATREDIEEPERNHPCADHWIRNGMGFAVDVMCTDMKQVAPFP